MSLRSFEIEAIGIHVARKVAAVEARREQDAAAMTELITELERRLAELERRLPPPAPRLVRDVA